MKTCAFFIAFTVCLLILFLSSENLAIPLAWIDFKNNTDAEIPNIVSREKWGARPPVKREPLEVTPTPYVVIHHGGIARYCYDEKVCSSIVRSYQNFHMDIRGWFDIGYNFVIGEDGNAYEGRGWDYVGAHAPGYNTQSIGICIIGDFSDRLPNEKALRTMSALIDYGLSLGKIGKNYHVIGHRQVRNTVCPGNEFYKYVETNPRWTDKPVPKFATNSSTTTTETITVANENIVDTSKET